MFTYTLLQILKAPLRSMQVLLSAFLVFLMIFCAMAFERGMKESLGVSGDPLNVMLLGMGSEESVERSEIDPTVLAIAKSIPGVERIFDEPAVSPEVIFNATLKVNQVENEAVLRGVTPAAMGVYKKVAIGSGSFPQTGEVMIGRLFHLRFGVDPAEVAIGKFIEFEGQKFRISGHFRSPGGVMESEVWMVLGDIMALTQRDRYSAITIRLEDRDYGDVRLMTQRRQDLQISAIPESEYYSQLSAFYDPIRWMAWSMALLISMGALFGGMNSNFASLEGRKKEFATLQAVGFSQSRLLFSMVLESSLIHLGAFLIAGIVAVALVPNLSMGFGSVFFSLQLGAADLLLGLGLSFIFSLVVVIIPASHILIPSLNTFLKD